MRIAVGGIHIECSTYNPVETGMAAFSVLRGEVLPRADGFRFLDAFPARILPTLHARAIPGGPVAAPVYRALRDEFLERLRACLPLDGLYLAMHGAMFVTGMEDAEGDWIARARTVVGPDCPIAISTDLHGNVSQRIVDSIDMFSTYRTAPHVDVEDTMRRAFSMLVRSLQDGVRPGVAWTPVPVLLPGERTSTVDQPAAGLYAGLPAIEADPGIWDASLMIGYVWADEPRATAAAVLTGTDRAGLLRESAALAARMWAARRGFGFGSRAGSIAECVALAAAADTGPVILADSGDNPTGGGVGDRADLLRAILQAGLDGVILASIADAPAVQAAFAAGVGRRISVRVGASLDAAGSRALPIEGMVRRLQSGPEAADREAVIALDGVQLVLAARRRPYHHLADFERLGLDPRACRVLVVKSGYLSPELAPLAAPSLLALSPGVVDQDVQRLGSLRRTRPMFPFDADFVWSPRPVASARLPA